MNLDRYIEGVNDVDPLLVCGRVSQVVGLVVEALGPQMAVGELCTIIPDGLAAKPVKAEVVGFRDNRVLLMPLGELQGISPGSQIVASGHPMHVRVGEALLGRVIDGLGEPIDGLGVILGGERCSIHRDPPAPMERRRITKAITTGVKALDAVTTIGVGQRLGIFAGSGVGKSTLMGMIARNTSADINVIALIGERGREVKDFLEKDLGEAGLARSVIIVATSDQSALVRRQGAFLATSVAEYFRDQGNDVMFMMDSVTRFCTAQREIGLAVGEPPATRGYTPSVFAMLPRLLERSGAVESGGSITGLYTVLVEGGDMDEPVADSVRSILDGHIVLSRDLAAKSHYPSIDILESISRLMTDIVTPEHRALAEKVRKTVATYRTSEDLIAIGAYVRGSDLAIDYAIEHIDKINEFLTQDVSEAFNLDECMSLLAELFATAGSTV